MQITVEENVVLEEILEGLHSTEKYIPSKYFYDSKGSSLFTEITNLEEYYLTRAEYSIFDTHLAEILEKVSPYTNLIEFGSGSSNKTHRLLESLPGLSRYIPVDISKEQLLSSARSLAERYMHIEITPVYADFTGDLSACIPGLPSGQNCVFFPGSTIGNFEYPEATVLLKQIACLIGYGGGLLIGVDLAKDASIVERAYNDRDELTALFNKNILSHVNVLTGSDFDPDKFDHRAVYNENKDRVEMYLVSVCSQAVRVNGSVITLDKGEEIRTEYSYKYPLEKFRKISEEAELKVENVWMDKDSLFSVHFMTAT